MTGKGWEVTVSYDLVRDLARGHVEWQGRLYPGAFQARCRRGSDGLEVSLHVRVGDSGPVPMSATVRRDGGIAGVSRLPLVALARLAAGEVGFDPTPTVGTWSNPGPDIDELQLVADIYREAVAAGVPVTRAIREGLAEAGVYRSEGTVSKMIHRARRTTGPDGETYLPPTDRGRKQA